MGLFFNGKSKKEKVAAMTMEENEAEKVATETVASETKDWATETKEKETKEEKTKNNFTEIVLILDNSGSMAPLVADTVGGYNSFIEKQKKEEGKALVTTVLFNHRYQILHKSLDLALVQPMTEKTYNVGGMTALWDAVGRTLDEIDRERKEKLEKDREALPDNTIVVIITDGMENSSLEYSATQVKEKVKRKREEGWEFIFLGANIDAISVGEDLGIARNRAANFRASEEGVMRNYEALNTMCSIVRMEPCACRSMELDEIVACIDQGARKKEDDVDSEIEAILAGARRKRR